MAAGSGDIDAVAKAMGKLKAAGEAAAAMEKARAAMGMMTNAAKKAAAEQDKLAAAQKRSAAASAAAAAKEIQSLQKLEAKRTEAANKAKEDALESQSGNRSMLADKAMGAAGAALKLIEMAAAAAAAAVTTLVVTLTALSIKAIEIVEQRAGLLATFSALGGGAAAGKQTLAMVDKLSQVLPIPREQLDEIAKSMDAAGFRGKALEKAITAVADATAIMHDEAGGAAAKKMLETLAEGGAGAQKMADTVAKGGAKSNKLLKEMGLNAGDVKKALAEMGVKGKASADQVGSAVEKALKQKAGGAGGPLEEMALTWPVMLAKLKEGFASLFEGLGPAIKPFMAAIKSLFGQFTRGTPTMKSLGKVVTEIFGSIFKHAAAAVAIVAKWVKQNVTAKNVMSVWNSTKAAVIGLVHWLQKAWAAIKPVVTSASFIETMKYAFIGLGVVIAMVVGVLAAIGFVMGNIVAQAAEVFAVFDKLSASAKALGQSIMDGITNLDFSAFVDKMKAMAMAGLAAFKAALGIASPSKVMGQMGGHIGAGLEGGLDKSSSKVGGAASRLGGAAAGGVAGGAKGGGKGGKGGLSIGEVHLHVAEAGHPAAWAEEAWAAFMERLAASQGL